jgi:cellulose biosynthesis protein BcsQ
VRGGGRRLVRGRSEIGALLKGTDVDGLDLLPADFSYRHMDLVLDDAKRPTRRLGKVLAPLRDEYDLVLLDCPPSISLVSESVFEAADALLVPLVPSTLVVRTYEQLLRFVAEEVRRRPEVIAFFSMVDGRKRLHRDVVAELSGRPGIATAAIPNASAVERMGLERSPVAGYAPRTPAARAYADLWDEVRRRLEL